MTNYFSWPLTLSLFHLQELNDCQRYKQFIIFENYRDFRNFMDEVYIVYDLLQPVDSDVHE
jgi:hypothetical protein